jgi:hypothetical protein
MVARGKLTMTGTISADGAYAANYGDNRCMPGGGSGGGVLLAASEIVFSGTINARGGGVKLSSGIDGGEGGGGRVAFYTGDFWNVWKPQKWTPENATGKTAQHSMV